MSAPPARLGSVPRAYRAGGNDIVLDYSAPANRLSRLS
jgi:hypothetical protein